MSTAATSALPRSPVANSRRACRITAFGFLHLLLLSSAALPTTASPSAPVYAYDVWPMQDGWAPNAVTSVLQSRDGYLWLGTYQGLLRYDGIRFTLFDSPHTHGLQNSRITSLYQDSDGKLWVGHETGQLTFFANGAFQAANPGHGWPGGAIEAITSDGFSDLWLLNDAGILFRRRDGLALECPGGATPSRKATITRAEGGRLWIAANGKLATLDNDKLVPCAFPDASGADFFERVAPAQDGALWVLHNGHIRKWAHDHWDLDLGPCPWGAASVTCMLESRAGALIAGTLSSGLYLVRPGVDTLHFSRTNGLSHDWVRSLTEDHEGNLWVATAAGLDSLRLRKVKMLDAPDHWQGRMVLSIAFQPDGAAWVGTEGAGLYHYDHGNWTNYLESSGISNLFVWSVLSTRRGELYAGTWGGGLTIKNGEHFESPGDLAKISAPVVSMLEGRDGEIWVGTTLGVHRFEARKLTWSAGKDKLAQPDVRAIAQTPDGAVWFGMLGGGLASFRNGTLKQFRRQDGLNSDGVMSLYADTGGSLWLGTSDNGLVRFKDGRFARIGLEQGLSSPRINQLVDDGDGNLWLGTQNGILRLSKVGLHQCADGTAKSVQCFSYGKAEGLTALNCSGGFQPGACKSPDGLLWFPTPKGIATIDPMKIVSNSVAPPVVIEELLAEGQPIPLHPPLPSNSQSPPPNPQSAIRNPQFLQVPLGKQRLVIRYAGLSFAAPDKVRFRCKLDGLESEWLDKGTEREVEYSYLPPGGYTFHVTACNNDGVWNTEGASLSFFVPFHFWQTWWFRTAAILGGAGAVAGIVIGVMRRRERRKLEHLERQRALERERARIARDIHDELGAGLTRITLLSQSARSELTDHQPGATDVEQIFSNARELTRAMDEIVWAVNPKHDTFDSLITYLGRYAQSFLSTAGLRCRLDLPLHLPAWTLTAEIRHNLFLAFKEALNNVVQHAHATEVRLSLELQPQGFVLILTDNGAGFDFQHASVPDPAADRPRLAGGNGLLNMQKRLEELGGRSQWETAPGEGTRVKMTVSLPRHQNR